MTLPRRIFGIETEYGITCAAIGGGSPPISAEDAAELLFAPITAARQSTNAFYQMVHGSILMLVRTRNMPLLSVILCKIYF
ncbi:hypothetical protein [Arcanobacterium hippocoleae]|uniref:hypothetical protein n=1 Tax=Arcanobacterium hippocoleae TaxID=149017 RepID=UPI0033403898